jgi:hypothetical protein
MPTCIQGDPRCAKNNVAAAGRFCGVCGMSTAELGGAGTGQNFGSVNSTNISVQKLKSDLVDELRKSQSTRAPITAASTIHAIGGVLTGIAAILLCFEVLSSGSGDNTNGAFAVAALAIAALVVGSVKAPQFVVAYTAAMVPLVPVAVIILLNSTLAEGNVALPILLVSLAYLALWALPGLRGRQPLLVGAIVFAASGISVLSSQSTLSNSIKYGDDGLSDILSSSVSNASILSLIVGIALVFAAWQLHIRNWVAIATVFIGTGIYISIVGVGGYLSVGDYGDIASALLITAFGLLLLFVGSATSRRGTSWISIALCVGGLVGVAGALAGQDPSAVTVAFILLALGIPLVVFAADWCQKKIDDLKQKHLAP